MDNRILSGLMADYEEKRRQHALEESRRMAEIQSRHPDLFALVEGRHAMIMQSVRSIFTAVQGRQPDEAMAEYNQKISRMLEQRGYPGDYLFPIQDCPVCGDTGYYYDDASRQRPCDCLKKAYLAALSQTGEELTGEKTFANFDETRFPEDSLPGTDVTQREYMAVIRQKCQFYAENVPKGPVKTLLLHGGSGLGKTYLLHCVSHHARSRGVDTLSVTAYDLLMALKNAYFSRTGETAQEYFDVPLLIIDDLGMEPLMENITVEQIYHLINSRLSKGLYTAVSTNLSRVELKQKYTERVSSRLLDARTGMTIQFLGKDIRLMK